MRSLGVIFSLIVAAPAVHALEPGQAGQSLSAGGEVRVGLLLGQPRQVAQDAGVGIGLDVQWFYAPNLGLLMAADYDRYSGFRDSEDQLSYATFSVLPIATYPVGRWIPWAGIGGGLAVASFRSTELELSSMGTCQLSVSLPAGRCPASKSALLPVARAAGGLGFAIDPRVTLGLRVEYSLVFSDRSVTRQTDAAATRITVFDDTFNLAFGADYYF